MPGLIRRSDIDEVRARTNLADIVGDYVTLKSAGVGSMKGLCPFHDERSPSFHVRPQVGFYHCFGCQESGDVYTFLQRMDHVTFQEAVERLAARLGMELRYEDGGQAASDRGVRARLLAANTAAEKFFREKLAAPEAQIGRDFLGSRGFDQAAAERFGVGFAPKSFDALGSALKTQGFTQDELVAAGLLSTNDRGNAYDRFRGRLVWPIRDVTGQTIGFGARKLLSDDEDKGPKYLNTPETAVYHKSQVLYGLDLARRDIAKAKQVVVVEGYTDVMACHLAGVTTAVATCGTAFGVDHIKVVRRVLGDSDNRNTAATGEVVFTFDPDEAGQKAASRAFAEESRFAAQTFVAVAPEGLDPCDLRLNRGDDAVRRLVSGRKPMFEFMIRRQLASHDLNTVEGRVAALRSAAPVVAGIRDQSMGVGYVRELAGWLGLDPGEVTRAVSAARHQSARSVEPQLEVRPGAGGRDNRDNRDARDPQDTALGGESEAPRERHPSVTDLPTDPSTRLERDALMALLQHPVSIGEELVVRAATAGFGNHTLSVVRDAVGANADHLKESDWVQRVLDDVAESYRTIVMQLSVAPIPARPEGIADYCRGVVTSLVGRDLTRRSAETRGAMQRASADGDAVRSRELQLELVQIEQDRRRLRSE